MKRLKAGLTSLGVSLVILAATVCPAMAQLGTNPYAGYSSMIDSLYRQQLVKRALLPGTRSGSASPSAAAPVAGVKSPNANPATRFKPTGNRLVLDSFVDQLGKTQADKDSMRQIFGEVFKIYEAGAKKLGFANDIAGAMMFFVATNYTVYRNGATVSDAGTKAILQQFQTSLDTEAMRTSPDADKQKMYETFILLGGFTLMGYQSAVQEKNADLQKTVRKMAGEGLEFLLKVDPSRVKVTDAGLEIEPEDIIPIPKTPAESAPASVAAATPSGRDEEFSYSLPSGWKESKENGVRGLTATMDSTALRVLSLGAVANPGDLQAATSELWKQLTASTFTPLDPPGQSPPVYRRYIGNGLRCFFTYYMYMRPKNGGDQATPIPVGMYVIEAGKNIYPLVVLYLCSSSYDNQRMHDALLEPLFKSMKGPVGTERKPLGTAAELAGTWKQELASVSGALVNGSGRVVGTAGAATVRVYAFRPDGTFAQDFTGTGQGTLGTFKSTAEGSGSWRLDGYVLVMTDSKGQTTRRPFLGINRGKDGGRLLTLGEENPTGALKMDSLSMETILRYYHDLTEIKK